VHVDDPRCTLTDDRDADGVVAQQDRQARDPDVDRLLGSGRLDPCTALDQGMRPVDVDPVDLGCNLERHGGPPGGRRRL